MQIRARWPEIRVVLRADSGFAREALMAWCEANRVDYVFGLARNSRLVTEIAGELALAKTEAERTGKPARCFGDFRYHSWTCARRVVGKAEQLADGSGGTRANPQLSPRWRPRLGRHRPFTSGSTAPEARWKTGCMDASRPASVVFGVRAW